MNDLGSGSRTLVPNSGVPHGAAWLRAVQTAAVPREGLESLALSVKAAQAEFATVEQALLRADPEFAFDALTRFGARVRAVQDEASAMRAELRSLPLAGAAGMRAYERLGGAGAVHGRG